MEAGISLFAEKGYASTSVREIVARAGVSKPVLYYYFKNKEGIFRDILNWAAEKQRDLLKEILETPATALDRFIDLYRRVYQGALEIPSLFKMIHNLIFGPPQGAPDYDLEQYHRRMLSSIKTIYEQGIALNEVIETDSKEVAVLVLSVLDFCLHMDYINPELLDPGRPERLLRLVFQGLNQRKP